MSLYKQLWLAVLVLLALVFAGCILVSGLPARAYLEQQPGVAVVFLVAMLVAGSLGSYLLKRILRPLDDAVEQASAIGRRHFLTMAEPGTPEFKKLVVAMNTLSAAMQSSLSREETQSRKSTAESRVDKVTGLLDRSRFMKTLEEDLHRTGAGASGIICLIHLSGLDQLNKVHGRKAADGMLAEMGHTLNRLSMQNTGWVASRINGSDFALLAPRATDPRVVALEVQEGLREALLNRGLDSQVSLPGAGTTFTRGETISDIMTRLDGALMAAITEGQSSINIAGRGDIQVMPVRDQLNNWRDIFRQAFIEHQFSLTAYPVAGLEGDLLHLESPARLQWQDESLTASQFLPWINRLELASDLDKQVLDLALRQIEADGKPVCINLSVASVADADFLSWLSEKLSSHEEAAASLWVEIQEAMAYRYLDNLKKLCGRARAHGTKVGIEHMGHQLADIGQLQGVGLDYMKIDSSFIRDIDQNRPNQTLVQTMCTAGHSIGMTVIAEGVRNDAEWNTLKELAVDGFTGPGVTARYQDDQET